MNEYINIFIDQEFPEFINKYLKTKTLNRLKYITQFCGCDYTKLYSPRFLYTRLDHSLVVAHMTWHFTHSKKKTIIALLHDIGTPCFAHTIDYVFDDYLKQESSERKIIDIVKKDKELLNYLEEDKILLDDLKDFSNYPILENNSPKLCTDRLDGVLHTCYVWLNTHTLEEIKEVYDDLVVLKNEDNKNEIGFKTLEIAEQFSTIVFKYAIELQDNKDKFVMKYISEIVKLAVSKNLITLDDLYNIKESEICNIFANNFASWKSFNEASNLIKTDDKPKNSFYISVDTKKRNVIPLVKTNCGIKRITEVSKKAKDSYEYVKNFKDTKYAYVDSIKEI